MEVPRDSGFLFLKWPCEIFHTLIMAKIFETSTNPNEVFHECTPKHSCNSYPTNLEKPSWKFSKKKSWQTNSSGDTFWCLTYLTHTFWCINPCFFLNDFVSANFHKGAVFVQHKAKNSRGAIRRWSWNSHHQTEQVVMFPIAACCTCVHISCFNFNPEKPLLTNGPSWIAHGAGLFPFAHMDGGKSWCFGTVSTWNLWGETMKPW